MDKLKPCPFCGGKDIHVFIKGLDKLKYASVCDNCGARSGRKPTKKEALQEWNRRAEKTGKWIITKDRFNSTYAICSECGAKMGGDVGD